jgi:hypothetical protein
MPIVSIIWGVLLGALSIWSVANSDHLTPTAFIPAGFGLVLAICGFLGLKEAFLKHAMHTAAMFSLLGFLLGAGRMIAVGFPAADRPDYAHKLNAFQSVAIMTGLCAVFVALCVNSFIQARRRRKATSPPKPLP